jgi:hypothetical protein
MQNQDDNILRDKKFKEAVTAIQKRAERQIDHAKLIDIFVQTDLFIRTCSTDNQLILGRRGTGKTHMSSVFSYKQKLRGDTVLYIDCSKLGSGFWNIKGLKEINIGAKFFTVLLNQISTELLDLVMRMENPDTNIQNTLCQKLNSLATFMDINDATNASSFNYRQITDSLGQILKDLNINRLFIILDEWAQIPISAQPYFAEFIKRAIFPLSKISIKILAVNYQCEFIKTQDGDHFGLQLGADITDTIDLDSYLIYDVKREHVIEFFGHVLYNHLGAELCWPLEISLGEKQLKVETLFTQSAAFQELVRAAEGNCRDFLCIFSRAYFDGFLNVSSAKKISIKNIETSAAGWFESAKRINIKNEDKVQKALNHIFEKVIKGYKSRTFMIETEKTEHPIILRLLNERILHKLNILYSHKDRPGIRYDLFSLDFGAYVKFKGTDIEPYDLFWVENKELENLNEDEVKYMVPFDDHRSIRRIVLDPDTFDIII